MWGSRVFRCASSLSQIHQHETHQHWNWSTSNASTWTPSTIVIHQQCNASTGNSSTGNPSTIEINRQCNPSTGITSTGNPSTNVIYQQCNPSTGNPPTVGGFPVDGFPVDRLPVDRLHCWSITIVDGFPVDGFPVDALLVDQLQSWWSSCWWIWLSVEKATQEYIFGWITRLLPWLFMELPKPKTSWKISCFFLTMRCFGNVFEKTSTSMFLTMFFKAQNIGQTMHLTMLNAHP